MNTYPFTPLVILLVASLAGCAASEPSVTNVNPSAPVDDGGSIGSMTVGNTTARAIPVNIWFEETLLSVSGAACDPLTNPGVCEVHFAATDNVTGSWNGTVSYIGHSHYDPATPEYLYWVKEPFTFTGSIPGCGSGSMTFRVPGYFHIEQGGVRSVEPLHFVQGSTTTGFAGVVDVQVAGDGMFDTTFPLTGTIWCM